MAIAGILVPLCSLVALTANVSCIKIPGINCIFVVKKGHNWQGRVYGKGTNGTTTVFIIGNAQDCKTDVENEILLEADENDPLYMALRIELLADAQLECASEAANKLYTNVDCNAFGENDVGIFPGGAPCMLFGEEELVEGDPDECLEDDETEGAITDGITSVTLPTTTDATATDASTESDADVTETGTDSTDTDMMGPTDPPATEVDTDAVTPTESDTETMGSETSEDTTTVGLAICDDWDPTSYFIEYSGVIYYDYTFVAGLADDLVPLALCDHGIFQPIMNGYQLANTQPDELFYTIGLRNGDIPLEVNGMPLDTLSNSLDAFVQLWLLDEESVFDLMVMRGSTAATLSYEPIIASP